MTDGIEPNEVSRHPVASIPETELSLADIERKRSHPLRWVGVLLIVLAALILPYWLGRTLAVNNTQAVLAVMGGVEPYGIALVGWAVTVVAYVGLAMAVVVSWQWLIVFAVGLAAEQFIAGICLLGLNFWYSTYVVYGEQSNLANAANFGIMGAVVGIAVYALLFVGLLIAIKKESPLNVLTKSWASFIMYFVIECIALFVVLFGGLLTVV